MNQDKTLVCKDCGNTFVFTAEEQDFFAEKGFTNEPTRCKSCRAAKRNGGRTNDREMFPAVCSACGKKTQVPFRPSGDKPVYCSDCFSKRR
ncbi:MAG TPA: zinc-ribbon domain containing protein [Clostridia bacterium]|nr:zinc-ribbon domain containing protein [Clostridia bacterium]